MLNTFWSVIPDNQIIEIASIAGFKSVILDMEHGSYDWKSLVNAVALGKSLNMQVLIRPASKNAREILSCLETGADGLMIPHVKNVREMNEIIQAVYYPPIGSRGASGYTRATSYGNVNFSDHMQKSNNNVFLGVLIESSEGLENISEIVKTGHISCVYFGTYDIALSLGLTDQRDKRIKTLVSKSIDKIHGSVPHLGQVAVNREQFSELDERINFVAHGVDCGIILNGFKTMIS